MSESNLSKFKNLLAELFMFDQADLDFGIYRIMNAKRDEITRFLDSDLLPQVRLSLAELESGDRAQLESEIAKAIEQSRELGVDAETTEKVKRLREQIAATSDIEAIESEVFSHLYEFFRRYYSDGDFLSLRRYKAGVYAIPYEGEEVKLHWANCDQYYIKTSENFSDYAFKLADGRRVHFKLVDADTEANNNKAANGNERRFILKEHAPLAEKDGELIISFEYHPDVRKRKQAQLNTEAVAAILSAEGLINWTASLATRAPTEKNKDRTVLERHLTDYTAKNTFDYFIHKDLGGFLRRELDFYIKNEVMYLDDIESDAAPRVGQYLAKIRAMRRIAHKIIDFLAQLEDFQKKLWLKKKFVIETNYCVTLDRVPDELYHEIAVNAPQREEWVRLFAIDEIERDLATPAFSNPLTIEFLRANPFLVLDTQFFDQEFKDKLLASIDNFDEQTDGVLIHSENFQALQLLANRYRQQVRSIYGDPPYNSDAGPINYKNGYPHSSWIALIENRLSLAKQFLAESGILCTTIDDYEAHHLRSIAERTLPEFELLGVAVIKNNPAGRTGTVGFAVCHEYALFHGRSDEAKVNRLEHSESQKARYKEKDEIGSFEWTNFRKHGGLNTYRTARPRQFYPIYVRGEEIRIPKMTWDNEARDWIVHEKPIAEEEVLLPIDSKQRERIWDFVVDTARKNLSHFIVKKDANNGTAIYRKWRIHEEGLLPQTWWDKSLYSAAEYGTNLLSDLFGVTHTFMFPKSIHAVVDCLKVAGLRNDQEGLVLDYFAGSGTSGHAIINLNREDGGSRKYLLVEMGAYFETVLKTRLEKVVYSKDWEAGKPLSRSGSTHLFKYCRLESYEDAINNLDVMRTSDQSSLLEAHGELREDYVLHYMLDAETRDSASLLNIKQFVDPFNYKLSVADDTVGARRLVNVDLVETFNYLIGLSVRHCDSISGFRVVEGTNPDGEKVLVIWRNTREKSNTDLDKFFQKQAYKTGDNEFALIYVNGDNNLENLRRSDESWKVRLIEQEFHRLMFDVRDV
ncbi:MAG TPA: DNA methyltransferase [Pyrinomonadaceae bacterium]|jgi:adenine-specific DNA-methyltransferase|nr:DNA methyltransferase [Pyrinomonadaceae bacterium]